VTHKDLVRRAARWLRGTRKCLVVYAECSTIVWSIPDCLGFTSRGKSILVECKRTRSDFLKDKHKGPHRHPELMMGAERWYFTPPGLLSSSDLPPGWGLAEMHGRSVRIMVTPSLFESYNHHYEAMFLVSMLHRHELGVEWLPDENRFKPVRASR
jgi:hypothetical protein